MSAIIAISALRRLADATSSLPDQSNYRIAAKVGPAFLARSKENSLALLVPLAADGSSVGRSGGGFTLRAAREVAFKHNGNSWTQSAAILECTDNTVADTFLALVADLANRLSSSVGAVTWQQLLAWMEEWQTLLGQRTILSLEAQLGLWAELLIIALGSDANSLFAAWRGPEDDTVDFFLDGKGLEVKASRHRGSHYVSQTQVTKPRGDFPSYFLSMWVSSEPLSGVSLAEIVKALTERLEDSGGFIKHLSRTGYSLEDGSQYMTRFTLLEPPRWYDAKDVPRVRIADPGVSRLRYVVTLDIDSVLDAARAQELWHHFCGILQYPTDVRASLK